MAYFQHKEVDLECRFGEHKREAFIDFQDRQLLDFAETDCPSGKLTVDTGEAGLTVLPSSVQKSVRCYSIFNFKKE